MPRDPRESREDVFFERLYDALEEGTSDSAATRKLLSEAGVNVDKLLVRARGKFSNYLASEKRRQARARLDRIRDLIPSLAKIARESAETARDEIARVLSGEAAGSRYAAFHRQLQSLDPKDIASASEDAALIDQLSEILARSEGEEKGA